MFENLSQFAERAVSNVSRRKFLGSLGRAAILLAAAAGGLLAIPGETEAAPRVCDNSTSESACWYKRVGDRCLYGHGGIGKCRAARGMVACYCSER
jgi:hypothetical protein